MRFYELTYLISPELSEEELKSLQEKINSLIQKEGGVLNEVNLPEKKDLSYPIKKNKTAYLTNLNFHFSSEKLENLEKKLKAEKKILRYLILVKPVPKVMVRGPIRPRKFIKPSKAKVELKEIEKKLEEILGE